MDFGSMLAGGVIGLVVAIAKDYFGDKRKAKEKEKQFKREQLEKLYIGLNKYSSLNLQFLSNYLLFLSKDENIDEFEKRFSRIKMDNLDEFSKVKALFSLYLFDELNTEYRKMNKIVKDFGKLQVDLISNYPNIDRIKLAEDIHVNMSEWITFIDNFEGSIPEVIKKF